MATDARVSQETVDQAADDTAALDARISQETVDQAADDDQPLYLRCSHMVIDYPMTPIHECTGGGAITIATDPTGGETFTGRSLKPRAWLALGFDA